MKSPKTQNKMNREDFPILTQQVYNRPLVYLDNAATTQKPQVVIDALQHYYETINSNIHRGVHYLSQLATNEFEAARRCVQQFINAAHDYEIIFTRGATEAINLVAASFGRTYIQRGDEIIISEMEHHSNIVPWQLLRARTPITLKVCPITDDGRLDMEAFASLFNSHTRLVSITAISNVLGTVNPVKEIIATAHAHGVPVLVDAAQAVPHMPIDVQALDCDFLAFSGHKVYGPTGIGVLYGREALLEQMPPYMGGGEMIGKVTFEHTTWNELPYKFEAGTPDYVATTGLARALDYITAIGMDKIAAYEQELGIYAYDQLMQIEGMHIYGPSPSPVISFNVAAPTLTGKSGGDFIHHLDLGTLLDRLGIAVRTGHHCAEPLMHRLGIEGTVRASFALYNTREEVDALCAAIRRVATMF